MAQAYALARFREWTDRSRRNLGVEVLDLVQLHCPPTSVYHDDEVFDALDTLVEQGRTRAYGVSVESCNEALRAIARPGVASVQIILNVLRRKPLLDQPGVTTVIPGARNADQARANAAAAGLSPLDEPTLAALAGVYEARVRVHVHHLW